jgi:hypothetical protein
MIAPPGARRYILVLFPSLGTKIMGQALPGHPDKIIHGKVDWLLIS